MSVLIKGLNIKPCKDGFGGKGLVIIGYDDKLYAVAHEQIIPLPDHGDLIDRDALKRLRKCEIDEYSDGWTFKDLWEEEEKDMDSLPVIIPAERSEK